MLETTSVILLLFMRDAYYLDLHLSDESHSFVSSILGSRYGIIERIGVVF